MEVIKSSDFQLTLLHYFQIFRSSFSSYLTDLEQYKNYLITIVKPIVSIIAVLLLFLLSIDLMISIMGNLGKDTIQSILSITTNPFISLFIGLLVTAIIQSSSTTTSLVVAMVASGSIDLYRAIPIVMGANIGTTITSNIVSLSFITKRTEFVEGFSTALMHNHFNIFVTILLFPLQYYYNFLGNLSGFFTNFFFSVSENGASAVSAPNLLLKSSIVGDFLYDIIGNYIILFLIAIVLLFTSIKLLSSIIYKLLIGRTLLNFEKFVFYNKFKSFGWGTALTLLVQSSSVTTSLIVPLVATQKLKYNKAYPFILGANIGTTITALLASLFKSNAAISIAVAHLMFNLIGVAVFLLIPGVNKLPVWISRWIGAKSGKWRIISILYIIVTFFLLPFAFIYFSK